MDVPGMSIEQILETLPSEETVLAEISRGQTNPSR